MPIIKSMRFLLHLIILINCISCFRREIDFSVVIVSSVDSIQFEDSSQAIDGEDAPVFTFHHLIEGESTKFIVMMKMRKRFIKFYGPKS